MLYSRVSGLHVTSFGAHRLSQVAPGPSVALTPGELVCMKNAPSA